MQTLLIIPHLVQHASVDAMFAQVAVQIRRGLEQATTSLHTALEGLLSRVDAKMFCVACG